MRSPRLAVAALAALTLPLTACGGGDELPTVSRTPGIDASDLPSTSTRPGGGASGSAGAADSEGRVPGARVSRQQVVGLYTDALMDATTVRIALDTTSKSLGVRGSGTADIGPDGPLLQFRVSLPQLGDQQVELRVLRDRVYLKAAALGPQWFSAPLTSLVGPQGEQVTSLLRQFDPRQLIQAVDDGFASATFRDREKVDGRTADRYRLTLDTDAVLRQVQGLRGTALRKAEAGLPKRSTQDVWFAVDGGDLLRVRTAGGQGSTDVRYTRWGDPVSITAPPASQVKRLK